MSWSPAYVVLCVLLISPKCLSGKFVLAASSYVMWMPLLQHPRGWLGMQYLASTPQKTITFKIIETIRTICLTLDQPRIVKDVGFKIYDPNYETNRN